MMKYDDSYKKIHSVDHDNYMNDYCNGDLNLIC